MNTITPKKTLIVASVMMKLCSPERTIRTPLTAPSAPPSASAPAIESGDGQADALEQPAHRHRRADADGADGKIEAAGHDHHHHRKADHDVDRHRAAEREEIELRTEARRSEREDRAEDHDQRDEPEFVGEQQAPRSGELGPGDSPPRALGARGRLGAFDRGRRVHPKACRRSICRPHPLLRVWEKAPQGPAEESTILSPALLAAGGTRRFEPARLTGR